MKKILFIAVVAFAFMACKGGSNGTSLPSKDKKALDKVTTGVLAQIGQSAANVDKYLSDAGFKKVDAAALAPRRLKGKLNAQSEDPEVMYIYGIDPADFDMEEAEGIALFNKTIKKNSIIVVYAMFTNGKLSIVETSVLVQWAKGNSRIYTDVSDAFFKQIPEDAMQSLWKGNIGTKQYSKQNEFVAAIAAAEDGVEAEEQGYAITAASAAGYEGFIYMGVWQNPSEKERGEMEKEGFVPYAIAAFGVADINAMMN